MGDAGYAMTMQYYTWDRVVARVRAGYVAAFGGVLP
jgi:hypothetical protein